MRSGNINKKPLSLAINVDTLIGMIEEISKVDNKGYYLAAFRNNSHNVSEDLDANPVNCQYKPKYPRIDLAFDRYNYWADSLEKELILIDAYADMLEKYIAYLLYTGSVDVIQDVKAKYSESPLLGFEKLVEEMKKVEVDK